jgi:L-malate glycosyltransferase
MINSLKGKVYPIIVFPNSGEAIKYFENAGIECHVVPFRLSFTEKKSWKRILITIPRIIWDYSINNSAQRRINSLLNNRSISIVHSNSSTIGFGQDLAKKINAKHVWHLRELLNLYFGFTPVMGWKYFLSKIHKADLIISITKSVHNYYKLEGNKKAYVLFNAVRPKCQTKLKKEKGNYILFCGAVIKEKGIEDALEAFSLINRKYPDIKFLIVGSYNQKYYQYLAGLIDKLDLSESINFLGFQFDVDDLMANAICLMMCSKHEALGRVTIEAMFNGCPVVGHASGGTTELIQNNKTGFLYNTVEELVDKVYKLIEEKDKTFQITSNAQSFAKENFSEEQFSAKLLHMYECVIHK